MLMYNWIKSTALLFSALPMFGLRAISSAHLFRQLDPPQPVPNTHPLHPNPS